MEKEPHQRLVAGVTKQLRPKRIPPATENPARPARLHDVAQMAGVSTATVSRCINGTGNVSNELRERIERVIKHLGWVPHPAARALASQRTYTIGAVVPTLANEHFARAIQTMQEELEQHGYILFVACSEYSLEREFRQARTFIERHVDALVLVGESHHPRLNALLTTRKSVFVVDTFTYRAGCSALCVGVDNHRATCNAVEYLLRLGHRSFGMLVQDTTSNDRALARLQGVQHAIAAYGLTMQPQHIAVGEGGVHQGRILFRQIMADPSNRPTAIVCANGFLATGAILEATAMGIPVPQEVSILGFDDFEIMAELPIPLTAIRVPCDDIGLRTAEFLLAHFQRTEPPPTGELEAEFIVRASTGPPPNP